MTNLTDFSKEWIVSWGKFENRKINLQNFNKNITTNSYHYSRLQGCTPPDELVQFHASHQKRSQNLQPFFYATLCCPTTQRFACALGEDCWYVISDLLKDIFSEQEYLKGRSCIPYLSAIIDCCAAVLQSSLQQTNVL